MTERLTDMFDEVTLAMRASLEKQRLAQAKRRQRWWDDIQYSRDLFAYECRQKNRTSLTYAVTTLVLEGMGDVAALRLLAVYLPLIVTLQRIELDMAKVPGYSIWPHDDIRMYTGNLRRVE